MRSMQWARLIDIGLRVSVSQVGVCDLSHTAGCVISANPWVQIYESAPNAREARQAARSAEEAKTEV